MVQGLILLHFPCFSKYVLMFDFTFAWVDFQLETRVFVSKSMKERWIDGGGGQNMWTCTFPSLVQLANNTWTLCSSILRQASLPRQPSLVGKQWMVQKLKQRMSWCCKIDSVIHQVGRGPYIDLVSQSEVPCCYPEWNRNFKGEHWCLAHKSSINVCTNLPPSKSCQSEITLWYHWYELGGMNILCSFCQELHIVVCDKSYPVYLHTPSKWQPQTGVKDHWQADDSITNMAQRLLVDNIGWFRWSILIQDDAKSTKGIMPRRLRRAGMLPVTDT